MKAKPDYDSGFIKVEPRGAGDYGFMSFSKSYDNSSHLKDMANEIKRHVDRVRSVEICYEHYICSNCGNDYELETDAEECCQE